MPTSESSELIRLKEFISDRGIDFVSDFQANRTPPIDFALSVSRDRIAATAGKGQISRRQMKEIQSSVKRELGLDIEWLVTPSERTSTMEAALRELLDGKFPGAINSVLISASKSPPVSVWIERNQLHDKVPDLEAVQKVVEQFLKLYDITGSVVSDDDGADVPSNPLILRKLKVHAPATVETLAKLLQAAGSNIPDRRWLQRALDRLRKQGLVTRSKLGEYCLTETALAVVPHGGNRASSDVERALALGRRKW
ncbi:MAG: hypothetical protein ABMA01_20500 [Chthoniobacteraceae bacterium]